jgi:hypothetical protein
VVGDGDAVHPEVFASLEKLFETYGAVEKRILAVQMKMSESFAVCHGSILSACGGQVRKVSLLIDYQLLIVAAGRLPININ